MNTKDLIKKYGEGKGADVMWKSVDMISEVLDEKLTPAEMECLEKKMYAMMQGEHYDEYFAKKQVANMYYTDEKGEKRYAPYWADDQVKQVWAAYKAKIAGGVNFWDFYVALNMIASDNYVLFRSWWPDAVDNLLTQRIAEATVNWLNDEDATNRDTRIWDYLND